MSESLSQLLHDQTLQRLVEKLDLHEVHGADGGPWLTLQSQVPMVQGAIGQVRVFEGTAITRLVSCTIVVPPIGLDSHMLFAFADTESGLPHFTVDSVRNGADYAFHLDLIPRLDLATHLPYMDAVFAPLTSVYQAHRDTPGLKPAALDPRQYAVMSPWMLVNRADESAFKATFQAVDSYLDHWLTLHQSGVPADCLGETTATGRAARDSAHRAVIFNADVDKVWNQIAPLIGAPAVDALIGLLRSTRGL